MKVIVKTCTRCNKTKPIYLFGKNKGCNDGFDTRCTICKRTISREYEAKKKGISLEEFERNLLSHEVKKPGWKWLGKKGNKILE